MTPEQAAMVDFLRAQYADAVRQAREFGNMFITHAEDRFETTRDAAEAHTRRTLKAAETRARFFDETVVPYLGTAGPTGRIADQQLRLLAWEHQGAHGYDEGWAP